MDTMIKPVIGTEYNYVFGLHGSPKKRKYFRTKVIRITSDTVYYKGDVTGSIKKDAFSEYFRELPINISTAPATIPVVVIPAVVIPAVKSFKEAEKVYVPEGESWLENLINWIKKILNL
jgi:hypothetical protein